MADDMAGQPLANDGWSYPPLLNYKQVNQAPCPYPTYDKLLQFCIKKKKSPHKEADLKGKKAAHTVKVL